MNSDNAIRVDASTDQGDRYLACCCTLGRVLRQHLATVRFIRCVHPGNDVEAIREEGFGVTTLPAAKAPDTEPAAGHYAR